MLGLKYLALQANYVAESVAAFGETAYSTLYQGELGAIVLVAICAFLFRRDKVND